MTNALELRPKMQIFLLIPAFVPASKLDTIPALSQYFVYEGSDMSHAQETTKNVLKGLEMTISIADSNTSPTLLVKGSRRCHSR